MAKHSIKVVFLAFLPYGSRAIQRFLDSHVAHPAGVDHELVVVLKGRRAARTLVKDTPLAEIMVAPFDDSLDIGTYLWAARNVDADRLLFVNTDSKILDDNWLRKFDSNLSPGVGVVGATGSWGRSVDGTVPGPNPHIRTTAFMFERKTMLSLEWPAKITTKTHAFAAENGPRGVTLQLIERGLEAVVVGKDGRGYKTAEWNRSDTFWHGEQGNLLISDKRTDEWYEVNALGRRLRYEAAWGWPRPKPVRRVRSK